MISKSSLKVLKEKTCYDYLSRLNMLIDYNENYRTIPIVYIYQFDQAYISDFLDYILLDRDSSARTRNNYRTWLSAFCSWLQEKKFIDSNPVEKIKTLPEEVKFRSALPPEDLIKLQEYLNKILNYIIFIGAVGLLIVVTIPLIFNGVFGAYVSFGGTSIIIVVGVILETLKQIESQMLVRNYKGFLTD